MADDKSSKEKKDSSGSKAKADSGKSKSKTSSKKSSSKKKKTKKSSGKKSGSQSAKKKSNKKGNKKTTKKKSKTTSRRKGTTTTTAAQIFSPSQFTALEDIMSKSTYNFDKLAQEATNNGKEQMEALVESGNVFAKGFEDIFKTYVSLAQETAEKNSQALKDLLSCKTLDEFTEAQSKVATESLDDFFNSFIKLSEMSVKLTTDAFEPINDQLTKTAEKVKKAA